MSEKQRKQPTFGQAVTPIIFMILALAIGYGYLKFRTEPLLVL